MSTLLLLLCLLCQQEPTLSVGARVRVTTARTQFTQLSSGPVRHIGVYGGIRGDSLLVDTVRVALSQVRGLEVSAGATRRAGRGIVVGAAGAAVLGFVLNQGYAGDLQPRIVMWSLAGGVIGDVAGAAVRSDRWVPVPLPAQSSK